MRTTLSLDDDVAAVLDGLRETRGESLKVLVNEALRRDLKEMRSVTVQWNHSEHRQSSSDAAALEALITLLKRCALRRRILQFILVDANPDDAEGRFRLKART
jgi:hypothetical protein